MVHLSRAGRGPDHLLRRRAPVLRAVGRAQHRQQHDAAEEEPGSAGAGARQDRPRDRPSGRPADGDEGAAERLQQGPAGGQAGRVRRRGHAGRLARGRRRRRRRPDARTARGPRPRRPACCSRPTWRTTWWGAACRSAARTKSSARWCGSWSPRRASSGRCRSRNGAAASDRFDADVVARVTPRVSVAAKRTPQSTAPDAVGRALAEADRWLRAAG